MTYCVTFSHSEEDDWAEVARCEDAAEQGQPAQDISV